MSDKTDPAVRMLVERFKRAAMATNFGYQSEDKALQLAGLRAVDRAAKWIDAFGPEARLALVPLLEEPDLSIRVFAAGYLVKIMPQRALAVLEDIRLRGPTEVRMTAASMLRRHGDGELDL